MDANQFTQLLHTLTAALQNQPAPQITVTAPAAPQVNITSDLGKPGKCKGEKGRDLDRFLSQCELYWVTAVITDNKVRVVTALNRFEDKAAQWAVPITDHMAANNGALPAGIDTWAKFKEELQKYFSDATPEDTAIIELNQLCNLDTKAKNARDVAIYVTDFKALVARITGLSSKDKQIRFVEGLPQYIYRQLAIQQNPPTDYDTWVDRALVAAANARIREKEAQEKKATTPSTTTPAAKPNTTVPRFTPRPNNNNAHVPMDVDASKLEDRPFRGTCFTCGKQGHKANDPVIHPRPPRRVNASQTNAEASSSGSQGAPAPTQSPAAPAADSVTIAAILQQLENLRAENAELKRRLEEGF